MRAAQNMPTVARGRQRDAMTRKRKRRPVVAATGAAKADAVGTVPSLHPEASVSQRRPGGRAVVSLDGRLHDTLIAILADIIPRAEIHRASDGSGLRDGNGFVTPERLQKYLGERLRFIKCGEELARPPLSLMRHVLALQREFPEVRYQKMGRKP